MVMKVCFSHIDMRSGVQNFGTLPMYTSKIDSIVIIDSPSQIFVRFSRDGDPEERLLSLCGSEARIPP